MKQLLIIGFMILEFSSDKALNKLNIHNTKLIIPENSNAAWPGELDTIKTNVFYPNGKRHLFY